MCWRSMAPATRAAWPQAFGRRPCRPWLAWCWPSLDCLAWRDSSVSRVWLSTGWLTSCVTIEDYRMRMRRHHYQQEEDTGIDLTPMLDVVFIMLIFFIVTSSFIKESGVEVQRPQADTASTQDKGNIFIAVTADGPAWNDKKAVDV